MMLLTTVTVHHLPQEKDTFVQILVGHWGHFGGHVNAGDNLKHIRTITHE